MPSHTLIAEYLRYPARLLIVLCEHSEAEVRRILRRNAHAGWEQDGQIRLLVIKDNLRRFKAENSLRIEESAPKSSAARVVFLDAVEHRDHFGEGTDLRSANNFNDLGSFEKGLPAILRQGGLDWRTAIEDQIRSWNYSILDKRHVEDWLKQFADLGVRWAGEHLLRTLDFWGPERLFASLDLTDDRLKSFDCICLKRGEAGKSGDFLSTLLRKRLRGARLKIEIEDFSVTLADDKYPADGKRILFIEDCLLTGTEMTNYLSRLLGQHQREGTENKIVLAEPQRLQLGTIEFDFPISTSLGRSRLKDFLEKQGFTKASLKCGEAGFLEVLTNAGQEALIQGKFFHPSISNCPADPDNYIERIAFRGPWRRAKQAVNLEKICRKIGRQLFENYLKKVGWIWPPDKIDAASLGMHGLGLNLASSHSVPKATLPLLWGKGPVKLNGASVDWLPLFDNAEL